MGKYGWRDVGKNAIYWEKGNPGHGIDPIPPRAVCDNIRSTFRLHEGKGEKVKLRDAQLGAYYSILSYRSLKDPSPCTVVMPTGTGKTETMVVTFLQNPVMTLIIVPSDALRHQTMLKMISLGIIPKCNFFIDKYIPPVVALIKSEIKTAHECNELLDSSNILISTVAALNVQSDKVLQKIADSSEQLFVDEAHHVAANTWASVEALFSGKSIVQFTATPFREDKQRLSGKIIYSYPLRLAQEDGVFSKINYHSIFSERRIDHDLASAAVSQLEKDLSSGYDHLMMVRVKTITKSKEILKIYRSLAPQYDPQRLDSKMPGAEQRAALQKIKKRDSRIIVCVDMLGEGFDLPALKIASIHEPHKSLSVTLQFVGRFARTNESSLGEASVFVPRETYGMDARLRKLYSEDADWNSIISQLSESEIDDQERRIRLELSFNQLPKEVPVQILKPKLSTVVFRVDSSGWDPDGVYKYFDKNLLTKKIGISDEHTVVWFVTENINDVPWGNVPEIKEKSYDLYVIHCDIDNGFLYINSTNNSELHDGLAQAVCASNAKLIDGDVVYRILHALKRGVPNNIGLLYSINRNRRFSMYVGADVVSGLGSTAAQKAKTNIFVKGYSDGASVGFGASRKGRIWSHGVANDIYAWLKWVKPIGPILIDQSITLESVIQGFILPKLLESRPKLVPLGIDWPAEVNRSIIEPAQLVAGGQKVPLLDVNLELSDHAKAGPLKFKLKTDNGISLEYELQFGENGQEFIELSSKAVVELPSREISILTFLQSYGVNIYFEGEAFLNNRGELLQPNRERAKYDRKNLEVVDWSGIDINLESQGRERKSNTVQYRSIETLRDEMEWDVIIDDDGAREVADIVFLKRDEDALQVMLVHCKYSSSTKTGARIEDFYDVCGQAQKCQRYKGNITFILKNLLRRERNRVEKHKYSGFILGSQRTLSRLIDASPYLIVEVQVVIVQPGLSKERTSKQIDELLGCTELYLSETSNSKFRVICSK